MPLSLQITYGPKSQIAPVYDDTQRATYMFPKGHFVLIIPAVVPPTVDFIPMQDQMPVSQIQIVGY